MMALMQGTILWCINEKKRYTTCIPEDESRKMYIVHSLQKLEFSYSGSMIFNKDHALKEVFTIFIADCILHCKEFK